MLSKVNELKEYIIIRNQEIVDIQFDIHRAEGELNDLIKEELRGEG